MTNVMTIAEDPSKPSDWMSNTPSHKLSHSSHAKRREYAREVLDFNNNSILQKNPQIANQIIDLTVIRILGYFTPHGNVQSTVKQNVY